MIRYSKKIYTKSVIEQAANIYSHICQVEIVSEQYYWLVKFSGTTDFQELLIKEFSNCLIELFNGAGY